MNKGGNSCKCYLKWPHKQVYCCKKIKLKLLMIVLFICIYTYMYSYTKIFLYNIAVLYHSFTHSIYLYMLCKNNFYLFHGLNCLLPGVNSAISVWDEWTKYITMDEIKLCIQWTRDKSKVEASNHSCDNLYFNLYIFGDIQLN